MESFYGNIGFVVILTKYLSITNNYLILGPSRLSPNTPYFDVFLMLMLGLVKISKS